MSNFNDLSETVLDAPIEDKDWCIRILKKGEQAEGDGWEFLRMAKFVLLKLKDREWAKKLYQKAISVATFSRELNSIAISIKDDYGSTATALKVMERAIARAEDVCDFISCAENYGSEFKDKDKARETYQKAIEKAQSASDYCDIAKSVIDVDYLGDKEWAQELLDHAEQMINNGECDEDDEEWLRENLRETREAISNDAFES